MSYVVYEVESTRIVEEKRYGKTHYATAGAAKAARTRMINKQRYTEDQIKVQEYLAYKLIEKKIPVVNKMTGLVVMESVNTPYSCSVGSDAYWQN